MAIIKQLEAEAPAELLQVGDTVKLVDSPLDRLKKGAKGRVIEAPLPKEENETVLVKVRFRVNKTDFVLQASSRRFTVTKHIADEDLPDAEAVSPAVDSEEEEA